MRKQPFPRIPVLAIAALFPFLASGCWIDPPQPGRDRAEMAAIALALADNQAAIANPLTPSEAVRLALGNNFELRAAEIDIRYQEESKRGSMLRLLPRLQADLTLEDRSRFDASYSQNAFTGDPTTGYWYSRDRAQQPFQAALLWNILDFGAGYLRARQTGEKVLQSREQIRRLRQQTALDTRTAYWRAWAAKQNARDAVILMAEMERQLAAVRLAKEKNILPEAEAVRRELALLTGMVDAEQWLQAEESLKRELARAMGRHSTDFALADEAENDAALERIASESLADLQKRALSCRPELYQGDSQARTSVDDARLALLQMAPNVNLSLAFQYNDDSHLLYNDWMTAGVRVGWNLLSIPARLSEKKAAELQAEAIRDRNLAMSAAVLAQTGLATGGWRQATKLRERQESRLESRRKLVDALILAEKNNQARQADVMLERIRLLGEQSSTRMQAAEIHTALARVASAIGLDIDANGNYVY